MHCMLRPLEAIGNGNQGQFKMNGMDHTLSINRKAYQPAYSQIVDIIRELVDSGRYPPGSKLPSEAQLRKQFQVSSVTVRRAISVLVEQGVVDTTQGKGTFVKPIELSSVSFHLDEIQKIFKDREHTRVILLFAQIISADQCVAEKLPLSEGDRVIHIRRLISRDNTPLMYHHQYLIYDPSQPIVEAELDLTALGGLFAGSGKTGFKKGLLKMRVTALNAEEARHLNGKTGMPAFLLEHTFFDLQDRQVSWGWFTFLDDRLNLSAQVGVWKDV